MRQYGVKVLAGGSNLILLSVGALADHHFRQTLEKAAEESDRKIYLPSGAIGGLDVLRAMRLMGSEMKVRVENRKAPESLKGRRGWLDAAFPESRRSWFSPVQRWRPSKASPRMSMWRWRRRFPVLVRKIPLWILSAYRAWWRTHTASMARTLLCG